MTRRTRKSAKTPPAQVVFDRSVFEYILSELRTHSETEEGGKYVGYVLSPSDLRVLDLGLNVSSPVVVITDFLPSGPNAVRTEVEFHPDGEFQEALFRKLEQMDQAVEHVGTWHSHHCNGLETLSWGDVKGYLRTVNRREYRLNFFVASLVRRIPSSNSDSDWIDHFLFVRGEDQYYHLDNSITTVDWPTSFGHLTGHLQTKRVDSLKQTPKPGHSETGAQTERWYETDRGRRVLAEDKRVFESRFGSEVLATRKGAVISLRGSQERASVIVTYPGQPKQRDVTILLIEDGQAVLQISCDLDRRSLGMRAAFASMDSLLAG
jgi:hypothetical protein